MKTNVQDFIRLNVTVDSVTGCWIWNLSRDKSRGYGGTNIGSKVWKTHRLSYSVFKGEIPPGGFVCHTCDNKLCCNPDHLYLGNALTNYRDLWSRHKDTKCSAVQKLSDEAVIEIIKSPLGSVKAARLFGVTDRHIRDIRNGKRRKGVTVY